MSVAPKRVVVVGAGLAGLATAIRLAAEGVQVTVVERGTRPGGKMGRREIGPYRWDSGPTIFTLPELFDQLWSAAGAKRSDDLTLLKVEPASRTFFADGSVLETSSDLAKLAASFGAIWAKSSGIRMRFTAAGPGRPLSPVAHATGHVS